MDKTAISWTQSDDGSPGATWNPTDGCEVCSPGCANCYAMRFAGRFAGPGQRYEGLVTIAKNKRAIWSGEARLDVGKLAKPLSWKRPRRIFVNSMSDLFYERFTNEQIAAVFGVMAACPQHTFMILTKRAKRMREWFAWMASFEHEVTDPRSGQRWDRRAIDCWEHTLAVAHIHHSVWDSEMMQRCHQIAWPLPNVWLGVSVENQAAADERIPDLLATPAAVRFLSCEPLLGPINLTHSAPNRALVGATARRVYRDAGGNDEATLPRHLKPPPSIDLVIAGCESGPGARPAESNWYRSLREQCAAAGVALFLKQATEEGTWEGDNEHECTVLAGPGSKRKPGGVIELPYLDGVQHKAMPEVAHGR